MNIKKTLHEKRKATEEHIKELKKGGHEGVRYTIIMPDIPFLFLALLCDIGWLIQLIAGIVYFICHGFPSLLDILSLISMIIVFVGIVFTIYINRIHEKEIATRFQKNMSFGLTILGGLFGGVIGVIQIIVTSDIFASKICMTVGSFLIFITGLPIYLSFKKGIVYDIQ